MYSENLYLSSNTAEKIKQISVEKALPQKAVQEATDNTPSIHSRIIFKKCLHEHCIFIGSATN